MKTFLSDKCTLASEISLKYEGKFPANIYLFKDNNRDTRKKCGICLKLTMKIPEQRHCFRSGGFFFVHFKHFTPSSSVSIVYFERVNVSWVISDDKELAKMLTNFFKCS